MVRRTPSESVRMEWPAISAVPPVGSMRQLSMLMVVDLPAPLGPSRLKISPGSMLKEMPLTASLSPKDLRRSWAMRMGSVMTDLS